MDNLNYYTHLCCFYANILANVLTSLRHMNRAREYNGQNNKNKDTGQSKSSGSNYIYY